MVVIVCIVYLVNKAKREKLMLKYNDEALVEMLMKGQFWQGQTIEQLRDSIGKPEDIGEQILKSKIKETWKYQRIGRNRFALKIFVENGIVVGWDKR